ncbi:HAMP domain-containing sensor histidine kinase [Burkholderia arboris]|uniref:HAMP domain-containing sensor histidine kinase n=1 Tax=Burkholderia arboris TaxID=488730 RepID=UPI0021CD1580|nr:HAMP domain-containing sensor histidine kinase [Burkholderia arboris]
MTLPARPGRHIGQTLGTGALVVVLIACTVAFFIYALHKPAALPHDATADEMIHSASTYLVLATALLVCLLTAAFDLVRLMRRTLRSLDAVAETARRIAAGDPPARAVSRDDCPADMSRFIEHFNAMTHRLKHAPSSNATAASGTTRHDMRMPLAELETRLDAIKALATGADASSHDALLHHVDGLFRLVDDLQVAERSDALILDLQPAALDREIEQAIDSTREAFREAGFVVDLEADTIVLACDGARIRQAVLALFDDVRRRSTPGTLKLSVKERPAGAVVRIEDQGARRFDETGLGVSVVRTVVEAHGGQVHHLASLCGDAVLEFDIPRRSPAIRVFPR